MDLELHYNDTFLWEFRFVEIICIKSLIEEKTAVSRKASTESKDKKMPTKSNLKKFLWYHPSPNKCSLVIILHCSVSLAVQRKIITTT